MKITYAASVNVIVRYDGEFDYRITNCPIIEVQNQVEKQMWEHMFKVADIINNDTGEIIMIIEKNY